MTILQLSVFMENREGRLEEVTKTLTENEINITSLSLADTSDYGMLRLIVSDPKKGKEVLKAAGFSTMLTEVVAVKLPHKIGMLNELLQSIVKDNVGIEYMYALSTNEDAAIVLKFSDVDKGILALKNNNFELIEPLKAYKING